MQVNLATAQLVQQKLHEEIQMLDHYIAISTPKLKAEMEALLAERAAIKQAVDDAIDAVLIEIPAEAEQYVPEEVEP